jgi:methionyl aminopeptidase
MPHPLQHLVKTPEAIEKIKIASQMAAQVLVMIAPHVKPGVSTETLDNICHDYIVNTLKAVPAPLNYRGFPKSICTSINHVVCHGIPSADKRLKNGDIINIDVTVIKDGYHGDTSKMFAVGTISIQAQRLLDISRECLFKGINMVKPGASLKAIGHAIEQHAFAHDYSSVREYCGHGIGAEFHEPDLQVLHYDERKIPETILIPGLTFTIEPMINIGKRFTKVLSDEWTVVTRDKTLSSQWEHTLLCTDSGVEILTLRPDETTLHDI